MCSYQVVVKAPGWMAGRFVISKLQLYTCAFAPSVVNSTHMDKFMEDTNEDRDVYRADECAACGRRRF